MLDVFYTKNLSIQHKILIGSKDWFDLATVNNLWKYDLCLEVSIFTDVFGKSWTNGHFDN